MKTTLQTGSAAAIETELLVVFTTDAATGKDAKPEISLLADEEAIQKAAANVLTTGEFASGGNEAILLHAPAGLKARRLLLVGLGKSAKCTVHDVRKAAGTAVRFAKPRKLRELTVLLPTTFNAAATARAAAEGAILADFDPDTYRSDRKDQSIQSLTVLTPASLDPKAAEAGFNEGVIIAESQNFTRTLVNEPGNRMTPTILGQRAAEMAQEVGLKCDVFGMEKLHELKMGAFIGVAQGSEEPPALIVIRYEPANAPADGPVIGLVGKGITFDTGGISIKPSDNMEKMKYDMAGGAAMIGAMRAIAQLKPAVSVIAIVCATENMPSGSAYKPGDVLTAMSGKTIDVINTDAEGRLVLADGLAYARQLGATHLINAATLTGAVAVALGQINAGVFSNDEDAFQHFTDGLTKSGERFWRLPLDDDYREQIRSDIADIKNTGGRYGGAITAAMFLKEFAEDTPWIHLDIASMAWQDDAKPWTAKGPTGVAVRSIVEWVRSYAK
ncbi:leucyl aminopeptidase [Alloacidobacterium dinghuense]|uniref:Probable cytosol aminopeptidase n=1 Tax=Alloacidobacterium dinghuense TaxID=2763107 RepID=A0A7G8BQY1_9BACT|nr:leucyl aminopeptidase [Alloacidobacterium dinghuense]QNI34951.1 leucyl aminopeptidase [Alloacidobacterium dinghuense]